MTLVEALRALRKTLTFNSETEAEQILQRLWKEETGEALSRVDLHAKGATPLPENLFQRAKEIAERRAGGELLQHLLRVQTFLGHEYEVNRSVLVPRPETEGLVFGAIERLRQLSRREMRGVEIGIGSGVISIELLWHFPGLEIWGTEVSLPAIRVAERNLQRCCPSGIARFHGLQSEEPSDIWAELDRALKTEWSTVDFLISNPPYLADPSEASEEVVASEPHLALFAPQGDPLFFYREFAQGGRSRLRDGAFGFFEIPHERSTEIAELFRKNSWYTELLPDLSGRDRVLIAKVAGAKQGG